MAELVGCVSDDGDPVSELVGYSEELSDTVAELVGCVSDLVLLAGFVGSTEWLELVWPVSVGS